jgi:hypothetical protein
VPQTQDTVAYCLFQGQSPSSVFLRETGSLRRFAQLWIGTATERKQNGMSFSPYRSIGEACVAQASYFRGQNRVKTEVRHKYGFARIGTETERKRNGMSFQVTGPLKRPALRKPHIFEAKKGLITRLCLKYGSARIDTETEWKPISPTTSNLDPQAAHRSNISTVFGVKTEVRLKYGFVRIDTETERKQNGMSLRLTSSNLEPNPELFVAQWSSILTIHHHPTIQTYASSCGASGHWSNTTPTLCRFATLCSEFLQLEKLPTPKTMLCCTFQTPRPTVTRPILLSLIASSSYH